MVTHQMSESHIPDVYERVVDKVSAITLTNRQYCYILDPYDVDIQRNLFGQKALKKGEATFFLYPKEMIEDDMIYDIHVQGQD